MNLPAKSILCAVLLLGAHAHAEFIRAEVIKGNKNRNPAFEEREMSAAAWMTKPGTICDVIPASREDVVIAAMNAATREAEAGNLGAALEAWATIGEANKGFEAEAVSMVERAKLFTERGQFENATELIDDLLARHSSYPGFNKAAEIQFDIANRLAEGKRRYLGGWFPWFRDQDNAVAIWKKAVRLAPNGPLADECLMRSARLSLKEGRGAEATEALEMLISDYPTSQHTAEAIQSLASLRAKVSMGPDWDQATTLEAIDHWRSLAAKFPQTERAKQAEIQIVILRDRAARARLQLAKFYWLNRNNPEAAKLMANACLTLAPESAAAKEAEALLGEILKNPDPPKTMADRLLGVHPRPRLTTDTKPAVVGDDLDALGFKKAAPKSATETERR